MTIEKQILDDFEVQLALQYGSILVNAYTRRIQTETLDHISLNEGWEESRDKYARDLKLEEKYK